MAYKIANWDEHYESAYSRKIVNGLTWIPLPTKTDGKRYRRLMKYQNGPQYLAAFVALLQIAAKMPNRGTLIDGKGEVLDVDDFEDISLIPHSVFAEALPILTSRRIGWVEVIGEAKKKKLAAANQPEPDQASLCEDEPAPPKKKSSPKRKPDPLFDAVAKCHGIEQGAKITAAAAKRISPIAAELRSMGATPDDVSARWDWMTNEYPGATISAIPKHWQAAGRGLETRRSTKPGARKPEPNTRPTDLEAPTW